jgi:hypothetical protein
MLGSRVEVGCFFLSVWLVQRRPIEYCLVSCVHTIFQNWRFVRLGLSAEFASNLAVFFFHNSYNKSVNNIFCHVCDHGGAGKKIRIDLTTSTTMNLLTYCSFASLPYLCWHSSYLEFRNDKNDFSSKCLPRQARKWNKVQR